MPGSAEEAYKRIAALNEHQARQARHNAELAVARTRSTTLAGSFGENQQIATEMASIIPEGAPRTLPEPVHTAYEQAVAAFKAEAQTHLNAQFQWPLSPDTVPPSADIAEARLATLAHKARQISELSGELRGYRSNLAGAADRLAAIRERAAAVKEIEEHVERFLIAKEFLGENGGPKILMAEQFKDITKRANDVLNDVGTPTWLESNDDFDLFERDTRCLDQRPRASESGGGFGNLYGLALGIGLIENYNAETIGTPIHTLVVDEPTICVEKPLVPRLLEMLSSKGRRAGLQTIIIEHEPSTSSYADHMIRLSADPEVIPDERDPQRPVPTHPAAHQRAPGSGPFPEYTSRNPNNSETRGPQPLHCITADHDQRPREGPYKQIHRGGT